MIEFMDNFYVLYSTYKNFKVPTVHTYQFCEEEKKYIILKTLILYS